MFTILRRIPKTIAVLTALLAAFTISAGAAYAYWRTTGSGTGSATTGTVSVNLEATLAGDSPSTTLIPGSSADAIVRVKNPNTFAVTLTSVVQTPSASITADNGCNTSGITFTGQSPNTSLSPNSSTLIHMSNAVSMNTSVSSACQGATLTIPVTATVQK